MLIEAKKLINLPVAAEDTLSKIGSIKQIVIDPETGQLLGFLVQTGFWSGTLALSAMDIKFWDKDGIITASGENLVEPAEIVRIQRVLEKNINLLEMPAETETGKSLGIIEDFVIDTETSSVTEYYLKDIIGKKRIMPASKVVSIDKKIVFTDDEEKEKVPGVFEAQTA
jgi:uncharacterized protein YrrD